MLRSVPVASVIVPTWKRPQLLRRALASLVAQTETDWEAVVVDDGAGEGIEEARRLGDPRIVAVPSNGSGQVDARLTGIERARGEVLCWLDDDDWWDDARHLEALGRAAAEGPALLYRGGWIVHDSGEREVFDHVATPQSLRVNNTILTSSIAYPRRFHADLGPLDPTLGGYCDWDFMLRICDAGMAPRKVPGLSVCYAVHDDNVSTDYANPQRLANFERFAAKHGLSAKIANHVTIHAMLVEGWEERDNALVREFSFDGFEQAVAFVNRVAELAQRENHHPDIDVRYSKVTLRWTTHDEGGITERDEALARRSSELA
jgi:pterin-4a-carbinolamine dehydratase